MLLVDLGVIKSHSRPYTSEDNPYSEAHFKTLKYRPDYPERFGSVIDARAWARVFFDWYNYEHHHSALGLLIPADVHYGRAAQIREQHQQVLRSAYEQHPERFVKGLPQPPELPEAVWINPPHRTKEAIAEQTFAEALPYAGAPSGGRGPVQGGAAVPQGCAAPLTGWPEEDNCPQGAVQRNDRHSG